MHTLMEELANLGGRQGRPRPPLTSSSKVSVQVYTVPSSATAGGATAGGQAIAPAATHASSGYLVSPLLEDGGRAGRLDPLKAQIVSHPRYHHLLTAFLDCHKVGCPAEAAEEIAVAAREREARQRAAAADVAGPDPELDQFMEAYCKLLVEWKEELSRPLREANEFLRTVESQLNSINPGPPLAALVSAVFWTSVNLHCLSNLTLAEENIGLGSSDDEQEDGSGMEMEGEDQALGIDPRSDDKELKRHLLKKYSGYLGSLRKELSKKKKKSKLPKEARQKLLSWWELHYRWPYPSEMEKIALAESTGLEQKQINNWFINQRKRHWKPSEEMQFAVMEAYHHPHNAAAAALYVDPRLVGAAAPAATYARPGHGLWHN